MYRKLSIPVGVAMLAALALVGMLGIFAFNASQPAQAAGVSGLTVMASDYAAGATANYTFSFTATEALDQNSTFINITPPMGHGTATGATVNGTSGDTERSQGQWWPLSSPNACPINSGEMATVVLMGVMNPATADDYTWMVDTDLGHAMPVSAMVTIVGSGGGNGDGMMA